jgi:hypothetical protein
VNSGAVLLFALGLFFLTGVVSLYKQGIKVLALICLVLAALAITGGALRL